MTTTVTPAPVFRPEEVPVAHVTDLARARAELACLRDAVAVAVDTETVIERDADGNPVPRNIDVDGPGPWRVMSIAARFRDGSRRCWVLDVGYIDPAGLAPLFTALRPFGWNAPFDQGVLARGGIAVPRWWDLMLAVAVLTQGASGGDQRKYSSLSDAARTYLGYEMDGKAGTRLSYRTVEEEPQLSPEQVRYAGYDALVTLELSVVLGAKLREAELVATFVRECDAQPFIKGMTIHGLDMDVEGYRGEVAQARAKADAASERIAVATTGREMLSTLVKWAVRAGKAAEPGEDALVEVGLGLLHDDAVMVEFVGAVKAQLDACRAQLGELTGSGAPVADLFSDADTFTPLPFDPDDETSTRRWLTKTAPHFTAHHVLASRGEDVDVTAVTTDDLFAKAGGKRRLTKEHDLEQVLAAVHTSPSPDVTDSLRQLALVLLSYRRYRRIHADYADAALAGSVLLKPDWNHNSDVQVAQMLNRFSPEAVRAYCAATKGEDRLLARNDLPLRGPVGGPGPGEAGPVPDVHPLTAPRCDSASAFHAA